MDCHIHGAVLEDHHSGLLVDGYLAAMVRASAMEQGRRGVGVPEKAEVLAAKETSLSR